MLNHLRNEIYDSLPSRQQGDVADGDHAIDLAVRVMTMFSCSSDARSTALLEHGTYRALWAEDVPFSDYILSMFSRTDHPNLNDSEAESAFDIKPELMARKLEKGLGLKLKPTDDIRDHLRLDLKNAVLEIYHYTAFLKEHLRLTKGNAERGEELSITESLTL
jgi:hypothetical protein